MRLKDSDRSDRRPGRTIKLGWPRFSFRVPDVSLRYLLINLFLGFGWASIVTGDPPEQVSLWADGAPGSERRRDEPEVAKDWWVANIHDPSLTIYRPEEPNGTGVVIVPGGGHRKLVFDAEGTMLAERLRDQGVTAFVLKHRLGREPGSPYEIDVHGRADGVRAMRWVRHHADEYGLERDRIGMMGFSAGGEIVSMVLFGPRETPIDVGDAIDDEPAGPNFQVQIYPGPLGIPDAHDGDLPSAFFVVAADDGAVKNILKLNSLYEGQRKTAEVHIYARGGHGFNLGQRSDRVGLRGWPDRLLEWMGDEGWLKNEQPANSTMSSDRGGDG